MKTFDVYPLYDITPVRALGSLLWDKEGREFLDLYGGHAVISIGHSHPHYIQRIEEQLHRIAFYSNAVKMPLQEELAQKLGQLSGYPEYTLFLSNSGAEANENALKLASFHTGRNQVITFRGAFHGRTSLAVEATDNPSIVAPVNRSGNIVFANWNDPEDFDRLLNKDTAAVIIEGIQGVGGVQIPEDHFLQYIRRRCTENGTVLILDEVQSGYGRSGKFFAHQHAGIRADIISIAKGMGNGFPVAGTLISPDFEARHGMLGTTFGGNYLACAAALAVLEVMESEDLVELAHENGRFLMEGLRQISGIQDIRGRGLMVGIDLPYSSALLRKQLLFGQGIFTGSASPANTVRLLPALNVSREHLNRFLEAFEKELKKGATA